MKKILLLLAFLTTSTLLFSQEKRINFYSAYVFDDSFESYNSSTNYFNGKIKGGYQWGVGLEFLVKEDYGVELLYYRQDTQVPYSYYGLNGAGSNALDVGVNYALVGFNRYVRKEKLEPFGGLLLGAAIFSNKNPSAAMQSESTATKFAVGGRLGVNVWVSEKVALKFQAQFLSAVQGAGGGMYFGTGGASAGVSTYSSITQFGLGGGLSFKFGQ